MTQRVPARRAAFLLASLVFGVASSGASGADPKPVPNKVLARAPFELPAFEQLPKAPFFPISATDYAEVKRLAQGRLERITYSSQGLRVKALVLPPVGSSGSRSPVVIYCRGGAGPGGAIAPANPTPLYEMSRYAEAGFFVIAPQYRGADGGEGKDEVGGSDVNDILALADILKSFDQADANQVFLVGVSRGAMMTFQAVRAGFPAKGIVATGLPADWELATAHNERLRDVATESWPEYMSDPVAAITRRSPARWANEISVPILLQHGGADGIINPVVVLDFARKLSEAGKTYDLVVYAGADHPLLTNRDERLARTIAWMRAMTPPRTASVIAEDYKLTLPEKLGAGRNRFTFENRGKEPHYFRLMRFADGKGIDDFLAWRKSHTPLPDWLLPAGGAGTLAPGEHAEYAEDLAAGRYVVFCGHPSPDGTQHVDKGMYASLTVEGETVLARAEESDVDIELNDDRIAVTRAFHVGAQRAHIQNKAARTHQALLVLLPAGVKAEDELDWFRNGSRGVRPGHPMGGVIELAAGGEAWAGFDLKPGNYLLICAVPGADGKRHFDHGMRYAFRISG